jgi:hypothetical protein
VPGVPGCVGPTITDENLEAFHLPASLCSGPVTVLSQMGQDDLHYGAGTILRAAMP